MMESPIGGSYWRPPFGLAASRDLAAEPLYTTLVLTMIDEEDPDSSEPEGEGLPVPADMLEGAPEPVPENGDSE